MNEGNFLTLYDLNHGPLGPKTCVLPMNYTDPLLYQDHFYLGSNPHGLFQAEAENFHLFGVEVTEGFFRLVARLTVDGNDIALEIVGVAEFDKAICVQERVHARSLAPIQHQQCQAR